MPINFWKYWTVIVIVSFLILVGQVYFSLTGFILEYDRTYISFINFFLFVVANILIFRLYLKKNKPTEIVNLVYYIGDTVVSLGLIGTLIGFMMVLWSVFGPSVVVDPGDVGSMTDILRKMAQGMSSALITSLTGILASTLINLQMVFLDE